MTLPEYLSGGRIQGRSDDGTTVNRTPLHDIDFTEYADQEAGEDVWVSASTSGSNGYMVYDHTNKNLKCRNQGNSAGAKICYYDLGASVNATDWRLRFRINNSSFSTETTLGKSYYTGFSISNAYDTADTGSPDWFGLKFIADGGAAGQTQFYGTDGGSQSGTSMSFAPTVNSGVNDIFVEWHFVSGTCTCKFFTDSDYDTPISGTATVTKSTSVAGLRYFMVYLRQDNGGNGDNEFVVDDFEFINGTLTETTDFSKDSITNVPTGTRYEETDTRKIFRRTGTTTIRALGDVVWSASGSSGETISGNDIYFDNGNQWNHWGRSTDSFTMGAGTATIIWKLHSIATGSSSAHTMVGFGKDPISSASMNYDNIEFYQYTDGTTMNPFYQIDSSNATPSGSMGSESGNWDALSLDTVFKMTMDTDGKVTSYVDITGGGTFEVIKESTRNATAGTYYIHVTGKQLGGANDVTFSVIKNPAWVEKGTA